MTKGWTTTKLITVGAFGVLRVLVWLPFIALGVSTGHPLLLIFSFFFFSLISVFSLFAVRQFGTVTLQTFVEWVLELPLPSIAFTPLLFSSALVRAFIVDLLFVFLNRREVIASVICGGANSFLLSVFTYLIYLIMGIPGSQTIPAAVFTPLGLSLILAVIFGLGSAGGYTGHLIYKKMATASVIKRIQSQ